MLLIFLPAIFIPACASFSPVFLMMYSSLIPQFNLIKLVLPMKKLQDKLVRYFSIRFLTPKSPLPT